MNGAEYVFGAKTERERAAEKPVFEFGFAPENVRRSIALILLCFVRSGGTSTLEARLLITLWL